MFTVEVAIRDTKSQLSGGDMQEQSEIQVRTHYGKSHQNPPDIRILREITPPEESDTEFLVEVYPPGRNSRAFVCTLRGADIAEVV